MRPIDRHCFLGLLIVLISGQIFGADLECNFQKGEIIPGPKEDPKTIWLEYVLKTDNLVIQRANLLYRTPPRQDYQLTPAVLNDDLNYRMEFPYEQNIEYYFDVMEQYGKKLYCGSASNPIKLDYSKLTKPQEHTKDNAFRKIWRKVTKFFGGAPGGVPTKPTPPTD